MDISTDNTAHSVKEALSIFFTAITRAVFNSLIIGVITFLLWNNCLVGSIDGLHPITWLQGWGIATLMIVLLR